MEKHTTLTGELDSIKKNFSFNFYRSHHCFLCCCCASLLKRLGEEREKRLRWIEEEERGMPDCHEGDKRKEMGDKNWREKKKRCHRVIELKKYIQFLSTAAIFELTNNLNESKCKSYL
ncbi:hypothetical protein Dimus_003880 [Dionaea muscipula]